MSSIRFPLLRLALLAIVSTAWISRVAALQLTYCSVDNTASMSANSSFYQSNGLCHDFCDEDFAFAIVQDVSCWCSNYVPEATSPISSCNEHCPGYPPEMCGGIGLFGYIALNKSPSGTAGGSQTTSSKRVVSTSSKSVTTSVRLSSTTSTTSTSSTSSTKPYSHTTTSSSQQSLSSTSPPSVTPIVTVQTLTGQIRTVTFIPTSTPTSDPSNSGTLDQSSSQGLNTGQAVGLTVGLVALVAIIGALIFFCVRKRRRTREDDYDAPTPVTTTSGTGLTGPTPQRSMSQNSPFMLGTDGRQVIEGWEGDGNTPGSRRSRLMPVDPRLDPFAPVYLRGDGSKSRDSVQTIQDNHDYSRRVHQQKPILRATNPD